MRKSTVHRGNCKSPWHAKQDLLPKIVFAFFRKLFQSATKSINDPAAQVLSNAGQNHRFIHARYFLNWPYKIFGFGVACCACVSTLHGTPPPQKIGYVPFSFINGSNNSSITYANMYVVVKGTDPATGLPCFISFDSNGVGTCVDATASTIPANYTYLLSSFLSQTPSDGGIPYLYVPSVTSARLYMSLNYKLVLPVEKNNLGIYTIGDPSPTSTSDPAYNYLYDKVEFNIKPNECVINPTLVDFFCFALPMTVTSNGGCTNFYGGMPPTQNREAIFTGYASAASSITNAKSMTQWSGLLLKDGSKNLRLLSTNTALNAAPPLFDTNYLLSESYYSGGPQHATWLSKFWFDQTVKSYYQTNTIWMDLSQLTGYGLYSGQVNSSGAFVFTKQTGQNGSNVTLTLPTSTIPFFAGTGFQFTGDATAAPVIEKFLSAGFESGVLPTASSMTNPIDNAFYQAHEPYYQNNSYFYAGTGPWYDLYSKVLHSYAVYPYNFYTYAYDDVLGNDNTITSENILLDPINITITLGNMQGTTP